MSYKQTRLAPVSYKDSILKVLFTFQVWARLLCRSMYFFVFVFSHLLYECVPCHTGRYQTLSTQSYKDGSLKVLFTFQVWARLLCRSIYFFVFEFSHLFYECVPCHTGPYQTLSTLSYKDSSLKVLFTFQVWARLLCRSMYFFVFVFSHLLYECVLCHTRRYQTLSTSGT